MNVKNRSEGGEKMEPKTCRPGTLEYEDLMDELCRVICEAGIHMGQLQILFGQVISRLIPRDYLRNNEKEA